MDAALAALLELMLLATMVIAAASMLCLVVATCLLLGDVDELAATSRIADVVALGPDTPDAPAAAHEVRRHEEAA